MVSLAAFVNVRAPATWDAGRVVVSSRGALVRLVPGANAEYATTHTNLTEPVSLRNSSERGVWPGAICP
jgi:hypothetical protein